MVRAVLAVAFQELGMHRVELGVFDVNPVAIVCYERVGFQRDGVRRDVFLASTEPRTYWSEVVMSILATDGATS